MKTIQLTPRLEQFCIVASLAVIRGEHIGPVPADWREIPSWWKECGRKAHVARQGGAAVREIDRAVALLAALDS